MKHPFDSLAQRYIQRLFFILLVATFMIAAIMNVIGKPLITSEAPYGIVSFELAGTTERAQAILASWDERAKQYAAFSLGFDYLFMLAYSTFVGAACVLAVHAIRSADWPLGRLGISLAWGMWLAAIFDAAENLCLSQILLAGATSSLWPAGACLCALVKFGLLFIGLVYAFFGMAAGLVGGHKG